MPEYAGQQPEGFCNLDYLMVHLGRNEATAMHLVELFLQHYPVLVQRMFAALETGDDAALRDAVHEIRSNCVLFSGHRCVDLAKGFEDSIRQHLEQGDGVERQSDWSPMVEALSNCLHCMADEMRVFLANKPE